MDKRQKFEAAVETYSDMITGLCLLRLGSMQMLTVEALTKKNVLLNFM